MVSLTKNYAGTAVTRQVKRATQQLVSARLKNTGRIATCSGVGGGLCAGIIALTSSTPSYLAVMTGAIIGATIPHYVQKNPGREAAKAAVKNLKSLKASEEYQNILARAKAIKNAK